MRGAVTRLAACTAAAAAAVALLMATGCGSDPAGGASPAASTAVSPGTVVIKNFAFGPRTATVAAGTTVTWSNTDPSAHWVMSDTSAFSSGSMATGATYSHTFTTAGIYSYHCAIHNYMTGTVVVTG